MALFRRPFRLARMLLHVFAGIWQAAVMFQFYSSTQRDRVISSWSARLLEIIGVRLKAGIPPEFDHGALLVANHVSWLDIFVIHAAKRVHFVSKHEVRSWPVAGWLAHRAGTLFIQRAKKHDTARINDEMHALLQDGAWVAVFPEGTSSDGRQLRRFMPSLFQPAVKENLPVVPAGLRYQTPEGRHCQAAAYIDDMSFGKSLWQIVGEPEIVARLDFGRPLKNSDRRALAESAYREVASCLGFELKDTSPEIPGGLQTVPLQT
jgi:1-acyl-sn-glycerol-3-phosphate acyltransferase